MRPVKLIIQRPGTVRLLVALILPTTLLVAVILFFSLRNTILQHHIDRLCTQTMNRFPRSQMTYQKAQFSGLWDIAIKNLRFASGDRSQDIRIGSCDVNMSPAAMLSRRIRIKKLIIRDLHIIVHHSRGKQAQAGKIPAIANENQALRPKGPDFALPLERILNRFLQYAPDELRLHNIGISLGDSPDKTVYRIAELVFRGPAFNTTLRLTSGKQTWSWYLKGRLNRNERSMSFSLFPARPDTRVTLPFFKNIWNLDLAFESAMASFRWGQSQSGSLPLNAKLVMKGLELENPRIATRPVQFEQLALDGHLRITSDTIELTEPSRATFNQLTVCPRIQYRNGSSRIISLHLEKQKVKATQVFRSLPQGLFTRLAGMDVGGDIALGLIFQLDLSRPEALILEPRFSMKSFHIKRYGDVDFRAINDPFIYDIYEKDRFQRSIEVGPQNPDFRPLHRISTALQNAVLICEDGGFYQHRGFLLNPFKESIVTNLKAGRFVRGGSTITMQLVKNLYLNRNKTLARKLEEMLITWLIEEQKLVAKERLFEVYLNIIEWGPGVYGIQEAARFYFQKDARDLNLGESIFLASIIPRPRRFMAAFDRQQKVKEWMVNFFGDVSAKMLQRNMISQEEFDALVPDILLSGPAADLLRSDIPLPCPLP